MKLLISLALIYIIYFQFTLDYCSNKFLRKIIINYYKVTSELNKFIQYVVAIALGALVLVISKEYLLVMPLKSNKYYIGFLSIILGLSAFIQLYFAINILISKLFKVDITHYIKNLRVHSVDTKHIIVTGYGLPIIIACFEVLFINSILVTKLSLIVPNRLLAIVFATNAYSLLKTRIKKKANERMSIFIFTLSTALIGSIITIGSGVLFSVLFTFLVLMFVAFKNIKTSFS